MYGQCEINGWVVSGGEWVVSERLRVSNEWLVADKWVVSGE